MKPYWKERVIVQDGCWLWQMCIGKNGYGFCKGSTAHKRSYEDHVGPVPTGAVLRHTCENKSCCNPEHLLLGTQRDNYYDMGEEKRKQLHQKAGDTLRGRVLALTPEQIEQKRSAGRKGGEANQKKKKSDAHKEAISRGLKRHHNGK